MRKYFELISQSKVTLKSNYNEYYGNIMDIHIIHDIQFNVR